MFWIIIILCLIMATLAMSGKEPPSVPLILGLKYINGCDNCIVGEVREKFNVSCLINHGSRPHHVSMTIENEMYTLDPYNSTSTVYIRFFTLQEYHHMNTVTISVINDELSIPLTATARVFVIKPSSVQRLIVPETVKEGDDVNIICEVDAGRPVPSVFFNISGSKVSSVHQHTRTSADGIIVSLTTFERKWNHKNITCCRYNKWYKNQLECSPPEQVNYLYQSSTFKFNISDSILNIYKGEKVFVECSASSNPASNLTLIEDLGFVNMTMKRCYMATVCVLAFNTDVVGKRRFICATQNLESVDHKNLTINILDHSEGLEMFDQISFKLVIWITIGLCLLVTGIVIAVILFDVIRKKLKNPKNKIKGRVRNHADVHKIRNLHNPVYNLRERRDAAADAHEMIDEIPEYALQVKTKTSKNVDNTHSQQYNVEDRHLHYADLDLDPNETLSRGCAVKRQDSQTEYADIDPVKTKAGKVRLIEFEDDDDTSVHSQPMIETTNEQIEDHIYSEVNEAESSSQIDHIYIEVNEAESSSQIDHIYIEVNEAESSSQPYRADDGQLIYVDLEFDPNMTAAKGATVKRQDSLTEYADIDYVQTLAEKDFVDLEDTNVSQKCNKDVNRQYTCKIM